MRSKSDKSEHVHGGPIWGEGHRGLRALHRDPSVDRETDRQT